MEAATVKAARAPAVGAHANTSGLARHLGQEPPNKGKTYPPEPLTHAEVLRLVDACGYRGPCGLRNRALIVLLWRGGLRIAEALALFTRDVDLTRGTVRVRRGKGAKYRVIGLDAQAMAVLEVWLNARAKLGVDGRWPIFCKVDRRYRQDRRPIRAAYVRDVLKRAREKAGIEKRVHPHGMRHTHAFELMMERTPMGVIQKQLGHSNLATTAGYVDHLAPADVVEAMQARAWPHEADPG
jgi:integrase